MEEFKVGDVVRLNSGSPQMTISAYPVVESVWTIKKVRIDKAKCTWFKEDGVTLQEAVFPIACLEHEQ